MVRRESSFDSREEIHPSTTDILQDRVSDWGDTEPGVVPIV